MWIRQQAGDPSKFFVGSEFIGTPGTESFIGSKAPTRFCELCMEFPDLVETKMLGRFRAGRIRFENSSTFLRTLPPSIAKIVGSEMESIGVNFTRRKIVPEFMPGGSVRMVEKEIEVNSGEPLSDN